MRLSIVYHVWGDGAWQEPLAEFVAALTDAGLLARQGDHPILSIVASDGDSVDAVTKAWPGRKWVQWVSESGNESDTLNSSVVACAGGTDTDRAILYAHTKGAHDNTDFRARWRRSMTNRVVANWRENLALLEAGDVDAVGCHWLTEEVFGADMFGQTLPPFFGGNFWMATTAYLRTLPPCPPEPRWEAERWIGLGNPRVVDLLPGWPHDNRWPELCV